MEYEEEIEYDYSTEVYNTFLERARLTDTDREALKAERGFSDETIDRLRFISCHEENREIIKGLVSEFSEGEVVESGLLEATDKGIEVCSQLIGVFKNNRFVNNICVPYINSDGNIFFIRPHKYGLKGKGIHVYCPDFSADQSAIWIITESEFKAAASFQYGIPAIGLPGIHSFVGRSGVNFRRLTEFIEALGLEKIVVVYDNEIKDNPEFTNYKSNVLKQWDTQWRAIDLCRKLRDALPGLEYVRVGVLPDSWMEDGKIDIDGALAQGRTSEEIRSVLYRSKHWKEYLAELPEVGKQIISRKIYKEDYLKISKVKRKEGGYHITKSKRVGNDVITFEDKISNFTMSIRKTLVSQECYTREIIFHGQDGSKSKPRLCLKGTNILREFKAWVFSCGDYHYIGNQDQLDLIWQLEGAMCDGREVRSPEGIGYIEDSGLWLFENVLVKERGEVLLPDDDGVIWDGIVGYSPQSINEITKKGKLSMIPSIYIDDDLDLASFRSTILDIDSVWKSKSVYLAVGWCIATFFSEEICQKYGCFPLLFIGGKRESGKTALASWISAMAGQNRGSGLALEEVTKAAAIRQLAWYNSLPYWMDEYRNNHKVKSWDGFFRNLYNRQSAARGTLGANVRSPGVNACLMLTGEETPEDNALLSRCVVISLAKKDINQDNIVYTKMEAMKQSGQLSGLVLEIIKQKRKALEFIPNFIDGWKDRLMAKGVGARIALNYAICAVCFDYFVMRFFPEKRKAYAEWVLEESCRSEEEKEQEHILREFLADLITIHDKLEGFYKVFTETIEGVSKRRIAFHFPTFYTHWTETFRRKGRQQFKKGTMLAYLREEPYYIDHNKLKRIGGKPVKCVILSLDQEDSPPDAMLYLADGVTEENSDPIASIENSPF